MKRTFLCILIVLTLGLISILSIYQYSNKNLKNESKVHDVTESSTLALLLVEGYGAEEVETTLTEFPDHSTHYLDFAKSFCTNGADIGWDSNNNKLKIKSDKADSCKLYFREGTAVNPKADILAKNTIITTTPNFSIPATDENTNIYQAEDDYGTSYYFRGASTNNYVQFGTYAEDTTLTVPGKTVEVKAGTPMYWRIVRVNGDESVRLIYDGTELVANGVAHTATIASTAYNTNSNDAKYLGYTYDVDGTQKDSTVKGVVDAWYEKHLKTNYETYTEDGIFCNDRSGATTVEDGKTYYASYYRLTTNPLPVLTCANKSDRYTVEDITKGNGYLSNPVGLLTADEAYFAGGLGTDVSYDEISNYNYYLYSGELYWTSTPHSIYIWFLTSAGNLSRDYVGISDFGARPVINLRADLLFTGSGSYDDPYKVAGFE